MNIPDLPCVFDGLDLKVLVGKHYFQVIEDAGAVIATADDGEQCRFVGCHEDEIRACLAEWQPGAWRSNG